MNRSVSAPSRGMRFIDHAGMRVQVPVAMVSAPSRGMRFIDGAYKAQEARAC